MASRALPFRNLKRTFVTPEGVDLQLELGSAGSRAGAFMIDFILMTVILVVVTIAFLMDGGARRPEAARYPVADRLLRASERLVLAVRDGQPRRDSGQAADGPAGWSPATAPGLPEPRSSPATRCARSKSFCRCRFSASKRPREPRIPSSSCSPFCGAAFSCSSPCSTATGCGSAIWSPAHGSFAPPCRSSPRIWSEAGTGRGGSFPKPRSVSTASTSCRRSSRFCATSSPMRSRPSPGRSAKRRGCPTTATIIGFLSDYYAALCVRLEAGLLVGRRRESKFD